MTRFTTLFSSKTFRVAGAVAVLAVTAPLAVSSQAAEGILEVPCRGNSDKIANGPAIWQRFAKPRFEPGLDLGTVSQRVESFSVSPFNTHHIAVTNGNSVYISRDAGCSYQPALHLNRLPNPDLGGLSALFTTIKSVFVTAGPSGGVTYLALAEELETPAGPGRPHVLRSTSGEVGSWQLADSGLPPLGEALNLEAHRTNPNVLYLTFRNAREDNSQCPPAPLPCESQQAGRRLGLMYASTDNGRTWQSRTNPADLNTVAAIKYVSVDDDDGEGDIVWVVSNGELRKSTNGGLDFRSPEGLDQQGLEFTAVESLATGQASQGLELVAFSSTGEMVRLQRGKWIRSQVLFNGPVGSVVQRPEGDIAVVTRPPDGAMPQVYRVYPKDLRDLEGGDGNGVGGRKFKETFGWESITPSTRNPIEAGMGGGDAPRGAGTYYVHERGQLMRFLGSKARFVDPTAPGIELDAPPPPRGRISPSSLEVDLQLGRTRTIDYTLTLPPAPTPLDVYLLIDNSGSMLPFINDLKANLRDVAQSLHATGVDVGIGVGQINVQPDRQSPPVDDPRTSDVDESKVKPIYQRLRPIGPIRADLFQALSKLDGNAGSGQEPQLEALYQSVAGTGLETDLSRLFGSSIPAGHDAGWRDPLTPIKVIVHATDENFTGTPIEGSTEPNGRIDGKNAHNDFESVAAALNQENVKQIGLSMDQPDSHPDLQRMARMTGALAPRGGIDCDGDGIIGTDDVRPGQPMVCGQSIGLDRTLVNLLQSLSDPATIELSQQASPTLANVTREQFRIDAKRPTSVRFKATFTCKDVAPGSYENVVTAALRGREIAKTVATVTCGGPPGAPLRPPGLPSLEEPAANPPPVQPQPVIPAPVPVQPVPQPQTQVQAQTQVNPQAGMADQEEQQFQLAAAGNDITREDDQFADNLAMTGLSYDDAALGVVGVGMGMASVAGVYAFRRRTRTAVAKARTGRF